MKKTIFTSLLISVFLKMAAQDVQIKKLQEQLNQHPQQDTFRINRLNELGQLTTLSAERRDSIANEALSGSRKIHYDKGEANALINLATVASQKGDQSQAFSLLQSADTIAAKIGDKELSVIILIRMGQTKSKTSENKQALAFYLKAEGIAQELTDKRSLARCQRVISSYYHTSLSDYPRAMEWILKSIKTSEDANCLECLAPSWTSIASLYTSLGDHEKALAYYKKAFEANKQLKNTTVQYNLLTNIGERYRLLGNYPEAIKAYNDALSGVINPYNIELNESNLADVYVRIGNLPMAFRFAFKSLKTAEKLGDTEGVAWIDGILARAYLKQGKPDSAVYYARNGLEAANKTGTLEFMRDNCGALANAYAQKNDFANAYKFQNLYISYRDSMINAQVANKSILMQYNYDLEKKQAQITALNQEKKMQYYFLISALIVLGLIAATVIFLLRNNRQKQKANNLLSRQKQLIEEQRDKTNKALFELQLTQAQLIQSEKMASLGELTAGIAHEIQNPLNFVNNFSEVNRELIDEMAEALKKDNNEEAILIASNIRENLEKINHHGQRADSIVKGMLQHSRINTVQKEPADINTLADEYLRLSYHGLRAKDKTFNATLQTDFDESIGKINIVTQDIGRVLLNLYNNAFYAVTEKNKAPYPLKGENYEPTVSVSTKMLDSPLGEVGKGRTIEIRVKDNGVGIPQKVLDKIFQPFFTTKPTGQGTGLGLSLAYDIVTKEHGGQLMVETKEGEGAEFIIQLPQNNL